MARLVVESGPDAGREFPLDETAVIGRLKTAQVALSDVNASREHTRVLRKGAEWFLVDLGSRNGTQVNGKKVQRHRLANGDRIAVGKTVMRFEPDGEGVAPPSTSTPTEPLPLTHPHAQAVQEEPTAKGKERPPAARAPFAPAGAATKALVPQTKALPRKPAAADKAPIAVDARRAVALSGGTQALAVAAAVLVAAVLLGLTWWVGTKVFGKVLEKPAPTRKK